ncbi:MAG TPA: hypothetical protein VNT22_06840 [Baekduia sp.]|nr:hypothetical protein [Baekduia sp.]
MASADGTWNVQMNTPMGEQTVVLTLVTDGAALSGKADTPFGLQEFDGGSVDGDELAWSVDVTSPLPMTVNFSAKVAGDSIDGIVDAGSFGKFPYAGTRA